MSEGFVDPLITAFGNALAEGIAKALIATTASDKAPSEELTEATKDIDDLLKQRSKMIFHEDARGNEP